MQNRDYKLLRSGCYYHVYNRGNNKQPIFLNQEDYLGFLKRLKLVLGLPRVLLGKRQGAPLAAAQRIRIQPFPAGTFSIMCYCLMPNHFHFLIKQNAEFGIDKLMHRLCTSYAAYFNKKYGHIGNLFQDRFKAKLVDSDSYLSYLSAYIHNNPANPLDYDYSSFKDYVAGRGGEICQKEFLLKYFNENTEVYKNFVLGFRQEDKNKIQDLLFED